MNYMFPDRLNCSHLVQSAHKCILIDVIGYDWCILIIIYCRETVPFPHCRRQRQHRVTFGIGEPALLGIIQSKPKLAIKFNSQMNRFHFSHSQVLMKVMATRRILESVTELDLERHKKYQRVDPWMIYLFPSRINYLFIWWHLSEFKRWEIESKFIAKVISFLSTIFFSGDDVNSEFIWMLLYSSISKRDVQTDDFRHVYVYWLSPSFSFVSPFCWLSSLLLLLLSATYVMYGVARFKIKRHIIILKNIVAMLTHLPIFTILLLCRMARKVKKIKWRTTNVAVVVDKRL